MIEHRVSPAGDWETVARPPHPALAPLVQRGYVGYRESGRPLARLETPHQAITVILNLGPPIAVTGWAGTGSFVAGLHDRAVVTEHQGEQLGIQMDLTPLGAQMLFGLPMGELSRRVVDLDAVLSGELTERLADAPDWPARFALLDRVLLARLERAVAPRPDVAYAWARLGATRGAIGIERLCAELGCSRRHLSGRFAQDIGLGPKAVARILRFRRVLARLDEAGGAARFAEIAVAGGYYDQSHLNRDFRELASCTPREYLARRLPEQRGVAA
ncbi:MAG TPA: helix-turn-helix domain-containing protein [Baekduia sp.]